MEEQFYLLFPFLIWFSGFARGARRGGRNLFVITMSLSALSLVGFIWLYQRNQPAAYFLMPPRLWELGAGCLLFLGLRRHGSLRTPLFRIAPAALTLVLVASLFLPQDQGLVATVLVVALTAGLIASLRQDCLGFAFYTQRQMVFIGLISYSLYLWHWGVLTISRWTIGIHWWSVPFQLALMVLLGWTSFLLVEAPVRSMRTKSSEIGIIGLGLGLTGACVFALGILQNHAAEIYTGEEKLNDKASRAKIIKRCNFFEEPAKSLSFSADCGSTPIQGAPTAFLLGDSHMSQFTSPITDYANTKGYGVKTIIGNGCLFPSSVIRNMDHKCFDMQIQIEKTLGKKIRRGDIVFIGNAIYPRFSGRWGDPEGIYADPNGQTLSRMEAAKLFSRKLRSLASNLEKKGVKIVIYLDGAQFPGIENLPAAICRSEWFRPAAAFNHNCIIQRAVFAKERDAGFEWIKLWQNGKTRFTWDGLDGSACRHGKCYATGNHDSNHFIPLQASKAFQQLISSHPDLFE